jgi:hypothetical protein
MSDPASCVRAHDRAACSAHETASSPPGAYVAPGGGDRDAAHDDRRRGTDRRHTPTAQEVQNEPRSQRTRRCQQRIRECHDAGMARREAAATVEPNQPNHRRPRRAALHRVVWEQSLASVVLPGTDHQCHAKAEKPDPISTGTPPAKSSVPRAYSHPSPNDQCEDGVNQQRPQSPRARRKAADVDRRSDRDRGAVTRPPATRRRPTGVERGRNTKLGRSLSRGGSNNRQKPGQNGEPTEVNANRFAPLAGGRMSLGEAA